MPASLVPVAAASADVGVVVSAEASVAEEVAVTAVVAEVATSLTRTSTLITPAPTSAVRTAAGMVVVAPMVVLPLLRRSPTPTPASKSWFAT